MISYIYPVLLSLIPAFHLYINNIVPIELAWPTWVGIAILMGIITFGIWSVTRNGQRTGAVAALFSVVFFYFEPFLQQLDLISSDLGISDQYQLLSSPLLAVVFFLAWAALWIVAGRYILRSEPITQKVNDFLVVVSLFLLIFPIIKISQIVRADIRVDNSLGYTFKDSVLTNSDGKLAASAASQDHQPDVFYLIFDAFAGEEILQSTYGMDISDFLSQLEKRGFYIASESKTNYSQTINALPSALNMNYLTGLSKTVIDQHNWSPLAVALQQNQVSLFFDEQGYELITFSSGYWPTEKIKTDKKYQPFINLNEYQEGIILNTPLVHIFPGILYNNHRNRILFTLNNLPGASVSGDPRFAFAHLYTPHPPFVFDDDGSHIQVSRQFHKYDADEYRLLGGTISEYQMMYAAQLNYLLDQILILVDEIFAEADSPPIIIIQGDHGPGSMISQHRLDENNLNERFTIMNAYYFPDQDYTHLYSGITPVNSFRVILNQYFDVDIELLEDRSFYSTVFDPYNYSEITEMLK